MIRRKCFAIAALLASICFVTSVLVAAAKNPPAKPIDLNSATVQELEQLPGVGPGTAKAIIEFRQKSGPFKRVEDLLAVRRITKQRLDKIRPYVFVRPKPVARPKPETVKPMTRSGAITKIVGG